MGLLTFLRTISSVLFLACVAGKAEAFDWTRSGDTEKLIQILVEAGASPCAPEEYHRESETLACRTPDEILLIRKQHYTQAFRTYISGVEYQFDELNDDTNRRLSAILRTLLPDESALRAEMLEKVMAREGFMDLGRRNSADLSEKSAVSVSLMVSRNPPSFRVGLSVTHSTQRTTPLSVLGLSMDDGLMTVLILFSVFAVLPCAVLMLIFWFVAEEENVPSPLTRQSLLIISLIGIAFPVVLVLLLGLSGAV